MKYLVIEVAEGDSAIAGKGIYEYATLIEAEASYHQKLATAMKSSLFTADLVMVINSDGGVHMVEKYVAPTTEETTEA